MERTLSFKAVVKKYDEAFKRQAVEMVVRGWNPRARQAWRKNRSTQASGNVGEKAAKSQIKYGGILPRDSAASRHYYRHTLLDYFAGDDFKIAIPSGQPAASKCLLE